jgi:AbrB family looped-hinge helix DNA binding protein
VAVIVLLFEDVLLIVFILTFGMMKAMEQVFSTVSSKGQLVIPAQIREALGITTGTRVAIHQEGDELILRPLTQAAAKRLIKELRGMTAGGPSMTDELIADRHAEDAKAGW